MTALIEVILPVFLLIGFGYAAARAKLFDEGSVDGVMRFAQNFALPCMLFRAIAQLDLSAAYDIGLLLTFYLSAFAAFGAGFFGARLVFKRPLPDAIAIGFASFFSNTLLLGLPITERAYGAEALAGNLAIISIHATLLYTFGIALMEWARGRGQGQSVLRMGRQIGGGILTQPLVIGVLAGFAVNLTALPLPQPFWDAVEMMVRASIPAALFGLGGVLFRYRPEGDRATIAMICAISLILQPALTYLLGRFVFGLDTAGLRSAVLTAAMAPGVNAYLFAHMYGVAMRVNASSVLFATVASIGTTWVWLNLLP
ncbi:AEC family transporter [Xinfangfangia sp. CPCC 101601]|uniref:AEC family transporter n=1 Tax=Pseudogemmobacter lacusdianii TaxID=3069608 RepID=A0ABU0W1G1_9RHOB|nr:AEC family transporter [Xinfangfangia sp. CPCC 101601]MDQ2067857.1 AEC family transporter [Xinfangfangia sp. CPCC 101601]